MIFHDNSAKQRIILDAVRKKFDKIFYLIIVVVWLTLYRLARIIPVNTSDYDIAARQRQTQTTPVLHTVDIFR